MGQFQRSSIWALDRMRGVGYVLVDLYHGTLRNSTRKVTIRIVV